MRHGCPLAGRARAQSGAPLPGGRHLAPFRVLGVVHVLVGLLLPFTLFFGVPLTPLLACGPIWLMILGYRLWRQGDEVGVPLRRTHVVAVAVAALLCAYGPFALLAAERSAAAGGGLLGALRLFPLALGVVLGATAVASLWLARGGTCQ
jgi:hypothetical protein